MEEQEKQTRKNYAKRGEKSQKMMSFRVDNDVWELLSKVGNKGRFLNDLVKDYFTNSNKKEIDYPPEENNIPLSDEQ